MCMSEPKPYESAAIPGMPYDDVLQLKLVEEMVGKSIIIVISSEKPRVRQKNYLIIPFALYEALGAFL